MDQINEWLYIGNYRDSTHLAWLQAEGIGAILQLADTVNHAEIASLYIAIRDGYPFSPQLIGQGMEFVAEQRTQGKKILIACGAGVSRSATFCMAALKEQENLSLLYALALIRAKHPLAHPHPALLKTLTEYYPNDTPLDLLLHATFG